MTAIIDGTNGVTTPNVLTSSSGVALTLQSSGTTALTIATNQAITVANTGNGITYSSSAGSGLRMYGAAGTNQWDVYGNGANIRFSDNTGGGIVVVDTAARYGSTIGVGGTTPANTGAGISFPATQSASSDANTLDDYEEGTFTPTLNRDGTGTSLTYSVRSGIYTKVGNMVTVYISCVVTAVSSSGSGNTTITGLPFSNGGVGYTGQGSIGYNDAAVNTLSASWLSSTTVYFRSGTRSSGNDGGGWTTGYMYMTFTYLV